MVLLAAVEGTWNLLGKANNGLATDGNGSFCFWTLGVVNVYKHIPTLLNLKHKNTWSSTKPGNLSSIYLFLTNLS